MNRLQLGNLAELQLATLIALGFFGFLRCDDLSNLTFDSIHFEGSHIALILEKRKKDHFRKGSWVLISSSDVQPCPVAVVKKFVDQGCHEAGSKLFWKVQHTKNGWKLKEQRMSYNRANELLKAKLRRRDWTANNIVFIACIKAWHQRRQLWWCQTIYFNKIILKKHWIPCC